MFLFLLLLFVFCFFVVFCWGFCGFFFVIVVVLWGFLVRVGGERNSSGVRAFARGAMDRSFQLVIHDWCRGCSMCYPVWEMHIKDPLLLKE